MMRNFTETKNQTPGLVFSRYSISPPNCGLRRMQSFPLRLFLVRIHRNTSIPNILPSRSLPVSRTPNLGVYTPDGVQINTVVFVFWCRHCRNGTFEWMGWLSWAEWMSIELYNAWTAQARLCNLLSRPPEATWSLTSEFWPSRHQH